jgi:hypothetical protein
MESGKWETGNVKPEMGSRTPKPGAAIGVGRRKSEGGLDWKPSVPNTYLMKEPPDQPVSAPYLEKL